MRLIDRNEFFVVTADDAVRVVRFERTPAPFPSLQAAEQLFEHLLSIVRRGEFKGYALLVDSRAGPGRNDEAFERLIGRYRDPLFEPFVRCAMLLRTQAGLMQSQRLSRPHKVVVEHFQDEAQAIAYLCKGRRRQAG